MKVRVIESVCQGHGTCAEACPEWFKLSDIDGHASVVAEVVPSELEEKVRLAQRACPEFAIRVQA